MNYQAIKFDVSDGQGRLTLNRPEKLNSFTTEMHAEIAHAIGRVSAGTDDVRVLVISGAGRAFCAGQDLSEGQMSGSGPVDLGETVERFYAPLVRSVQALSVPVVAAVNGVAAGAGANLALACDIVIAASRPRSCSRLRSGISHFTLRGANFRSAGHFADLVVLHEARKTERSSYSSIRTLLKKWSSSR